MQNTAPRQGIAGAAEYLAAQGRNGDTMLSHTTAGETIIPQELLDKNPNLRKDLQNAFDYEDIPMDQYVVGSGVMSINPETGLPEFGWLSKTWKSVRKTVKKAGPVIGAIVGGMIGGPIGASIGAGIGTHTSAMPKEDILRNMAIAYGGANIIQGAGVGGATGAAKTAASSAGGWSNPFAAAWDGVGAFFQGANWTPMGVGETSGIGGFFQDIGGGAARSMGWGGTQTLVDAGLTGAEAQQVAAAMQNGTSAVNAAQAIGITDTTILRSLASSAGPGLMNAGGTAWATMNPLEKWAVQTGFDVATGVALEQGETEGMRDAQAYMGRGLTSGGAIPQQDIQGSGVGMAGGQQIGGNINASSFQQGVNAPRTTTITDTRGGNTAMLPMASGQNAPMQQAPAYESAIARTSQGNELLDLLAGNLSKRQLEGAPGLASLTTPFPVFAPPTFQAANGGLVGYSEGGLRAADGTTPSYAQLQLPESLADRTYYQKLEIQELLSDMASLASSNSPKRTQANNYIPMLEEKTGLSRNDSQFQEMLQNALKQAIDKQFYQGGFVGSDRNMFMGGGYVQGPGGERDDMVNAKLSNNEFVMTADAVRGAGNGSIQQGADKMYQMMNNFERRA